MGQALLEQRIVERLLEEGNEVIIQYFQSDLKALQDKYKGEAVEFIQADLTQNIDLKLPCSYQIFRLFDIQ